MICGLNCDPAHFEDYDVLARDLKAAGATMARFPLVDAADPRIYGAFSDALLLHGLQPLPVYARESQLAGVTHGESLGWWCGYLSNVTHWQIGNEADHQSPSSWTMTESGFSKLLRDARKFLHPGSFIIAGAMVSGHPEYLDGVDLGPVDGLAAHPYGQRVNGLPFKAWGFGEFSDLIERYKRFGKPIWITECGGPIRDFRSQAERAVYYATLVSAAAESGCAGVLPFKYEDEGVPGFGMRGTPALEAFRQASTTMQASGTAKSGSRHGNGLDEGGPMKLEEVANKHGGLYSPAVVLGGTKAKPTARIGWVNDTANGFVLEINGEAADAVYAPKA